VAGLVASSTYTYKYICIYIYIHISNLVVLHPLIRPPGRSSGTGGTDGVGMARTLINDIVVRSPQRSGIDYRYIQPGCSSSSDPSSRKVGRSSGTGGTDGVRMARTLINDIVVRSPQRSGKALHEGQTALAGLAEWHGVRSLDQ